MLQLWSCGGIKMAFERRAGALERYHFPQTKPKTRNPVPETQQNTSEPVSMHGD